MFTNRNSLLKPSKANRDRNSRYLMAGFTWLCIGKALHPKHPQPEYGAVGNKRKGVGMVEVEVLWRIISNQGQAHDAENVNEVNGQNPCRQIPELGFAVAGISNDENGKKEHQGNAVAWPADPYAAGSVDAEHLEIIHLAAGKGLIAEQIQDALAAIQDQADEHLIDAGVTFNDELV